jgi:hypothetical protein
MCNIASIDRQMRSTERAIAARYAASGERPTQIRRKLLVA